MTPAGTSRGRRILSAAVVALIGAAGGYGLARWQGPAAPPPAPAPTRAPLYWYDPMNPAQHFAGPGKSPFMDMPLTPRYADQAAGAGVAIDPAAVQSLGVRLVSVQRGDLSQSVEAAGVLDFDQRDIAVIQTRAAGFVQRVYGHAPGDLVRAGAPLVDLLTPGWTGAQAEYLAVRRDGDPALEAAARQRLRLLGMSEAVIAAVARDGKPRPVTTVTTPIGGTIQTLEARQGMTVAIGQTLAQISGLSTVWLNAAVPEALAGQARLGAQARAELAAFPGETFTGRVAAILPATQTDSHTVTVRVELANPGDRLRPGMFAAVHLAGPAHEGLFLPSEAVIRTGRRAVVMAAGEHGRFEPVEVRVGREAGDRLEILAGLEEGRKVVASGQFLIDSEASLSGVHARPLAAAPPPAATTATTATTATVYETRGRVEALSGDRITLSHQAVPGLGWPAMTMSFTLEHPDLARGIKVGDRVVFGFIQTPDGAVVQRLQRAGAQ